MHPKVHTVLSSQVLSRRMEESKEHGSSCLGFRGLGFSESSCLGFRDMGLRV